jgi:hypothetical protein
MDSSFRYSGGIFRRLRTFTQPGSRPIVSLEENGWNRRLKNLNSRRSHAHWLPQIADFASSGLPI